MCDGWRIKLRENLQFRRSVSSYLLIVMILIAIRTIPRKQTTLSKRCAILLPSQLGSLCPVYKHCFKFYMTVVWTLKWRCVRTGNGLTRSQISNPYQHCVRGPVNSAAAQSFLNFDNIFISHIFTSFNSYRFKGCVYWKDSDRKSELARKIPCRLQTVRHCFLFLLTSDFAHIY